MAALPSWYKFKPKKDRLITHYLQPKLQNGEQPVNGIVIQEANVYQYHHPRDLMKNMPPQHGCLEELYVFSPKKQRTLGSQSQSTGHWRIDRTETDVKMGNEKVGKTRILAFYEGKFDKNAPRSEYRVQEYSLLIPTDLVVCRIFKVKRHQQEQQDEDIDGDAAFDHTFILTLGPDFLFLPSEKQLLQFLLMKVLKQNLPPNHIINVEDYRSTSLKHLEETYAGADGWYIFTQSTKGKQGKQGLRNCADGHWKGVGFYSDVPIKDGHMGSKVDCVFMEKDNEGGVFKWRMKEYRIKSELSSAKTTVLLHIYKNTKVTGGFPVAALQQVERPLLQEKVCLEVNLGCGSLWTPLPAQQVTMPTSLKKVYLEPKLVFGPVETPVPLHQVTMPASTETLCLELKLGSGQIETPVPSHQVATPASSETLCLELKLGSGPVETPVTPQQVTPPASPDNVHQ